MYKRQDQHPDDEWEIVGRVEQRKRVPVVGQVELHHHEVIGDQQDGAARGEGDADDHDVEQQLFQRETAAFEAVGREIAQSPSVLMTAYAVRGLDINTSYTIYNLLTEQKMKGVAVVYVGEDLDVLLELCDRIVVLCGGQVSGVVDARKTDKRQVGVLMTRVEGGKAKNE